MEATITSCWQDLCTRCPQWKDAAAPFAAAVRLLAESVAAGGKILLCGNGGSAADAEHIVGELMKSFLLPRPLPESFCRRARDMFPRQAAELARLQGGIAAIPLVSGVALPTAFANDVDGQLGFAQQVYALARPGDVVWGLSTSGNSHNVNQALRVARLLSCHTLGLTGRDGGKMQRYVDREETICGPFLGRVMEKALKMGESNACMKRIVAAPTAGACGVVPAVLLAMQETAGYSDEEMTQALYVAAGIGGVIASRAFISGAQGGCQAEVGSASSMAAGAAAFLRGADASAIAHGAAMAMKNLLGLVCDPVAGLVEVPCVKRNVAGAVVALAAADMALAGIRSKIPPDEVIDAMRSVGQDMPVCVRETGEGGLAATPSGERMKDYLTQG